MRQKLKPTIILVFLFFFCLSSCEKHDGIYYSKWKCCARLNGRSYIDQRPIGVIFAPDVAATPRLLLDSTEVVFQSFLRTQRDGDLAYAVEICIFSDTPEGYLDTDWIIDLADIDLSGTDGAESGMKIWEYEKYCREHRISYARIGSRVNDELVSKGTFRVSRDKRGNNSGSFALTFSEGTLEGRFGL